MARRSIEKAEEMMLERIERAQHELRERMAMVAEQKAVIRGMEEALMIIRSNPPDEVTS